MTREFNNILIADEHQMFAEGLKTMLMIRRHLGEPLIVNSSPELFEIVKQFQFNLVILGVDIQHDGDVSVLNQLRTENPWLRILTMGSIVPTDLINKLFMADADGFISKESEPEKFFDAIEAILNDGLYYPGILRNLLTSNIKVRTTDRSFLNNLSEIETEVIGFICQEYTIDDIARELQLNPETVHVILKSIFFRTGVTNLTALYKLLYEKGLFD